MDTVRKVELAVLFADLSGSTDLYERAGDEAAREAVSGCHKAARAVVAAHGGAVVKEIGDELMCRFVAVQDAVAAADGIHRALRDRRAGGRFDASLSMRIGVHYGPVLDEGQDVHGDTVNVAARMVQQAKAGETIVSRAVWHALPAERREACRLVDVSPLKGKREEMHIYRALWQPERATRALLPERDLTDRSALELRMYVRYKGKTRTIERERPALTLGREEDCDVCVDGEQASRRHAKLELRRDKLYVKDQSTNGTYVRNAGRETFLHREEMPVFGGGELSLGAPFSECPAEEVVSFSEKSASKA